jgi:murein L,D-transpeptidase YcbB/YkuD
VRRRGLLRALAALALAPGGARAGTWTDDGGRPTAAARAALAVLATAATEGLDAADYGGPALPDAAARLERQPDVEAARAFDAALAQALQRFLRDLHLGRVAPAALGFRLPSREREHDFAELASRAATAGPAAAAREMTPALVPYAELRRHLAALRALATREAWPPLPRRPPTPRPGDRDPLVAELHRRLQALGDIDPASMAPGSLEEALDEGLRRFQARHGLEADGVAGRSTWAALAVPPARRARQVELAMERLRWLPHGDGRRAVVVNIPMFRLWSRDPQAAGGTGPQMAVIVGRAMKTGTPVFVDEMRYLIFRPYWNVPPSIVRGEILPAIARQRGYLERHHMEIVRGPGDDAQPVAASEENLALLREGVLRLRQRPGPDNALGLVKFIFPNDANVYLHGTPAPQLFQRARRDFSHGCIRIEDPVAMAEWVLAEQPGWTRERIVEAMNGSASRRVDLKTPIRVVIYYLTALALPGEPQPRFAEDLYGHDAALERALAAGRR